MTTQGAVTGRRHTKRLHNRTHLRRVSTSSPYTDRLGLPTQTDSYEQQPFECMRRSRSNARMAFAAH